MSRNLKAIWSAEALSDINNWSNDTVEDFDRQWIQNFVFLSKIIKDEMDKELLKVSKIVLFEDESI